MIGLVVLVAAGCSGGTSASVFIDTPEDGARVESPVQLRMGADGFSLEPAGEAREGAGHLHLMIDTGCTPVGETIPDDETHRRLEDGSTQTVLELPAGEHTLCLQAGDGVHSALDLTDEITITVVASGGDTETEVETGETLEGEVWEGTFTYDLYGASACSARYAVKFVFVFGSVDVSDDTALGDLSLVTSSCPGTPSRASITATKEGRTMSVEFFGGKGKLPIRGGNRVTAQFSLYPEIEKRVLDVRCVVNCDR